MNPLSRTVVTGARLHGLFLPFTCRLTMSTLSHKSKNRNAAEYRYRLVLSWRWLFCECPESGGRQLSRWELDELLAEAALLIEVATDSDAVNNDLTKPKIKLHGNGDYTMDRSFHETMMRPFLTAYFREEIRKRGREVQRIVSEQASR